MPTDSDKTAVVKDKENPYSLANMKKAYQALQTTARNVMPASDLKATHYYIKFLPANWEEYTVLVNFDTLNVYNYPLDKDIENPANYRDPSTPENMPMPQYASVPVGLNIDALGVRYEKLEDLFIPDDFEAPANSQSPEIQALHSSPAKRDFIIQLVNTAMVQTGNDDDVIKPTTARAAYVPSGRIRVFDTRMGTLIPLRGVRVEARRWFTTHHGYTDANGNYRVNGDFKRQCNYSLIFETGDFDIRTGTFGQAKIDGPRQEGAWNLDIQDGVNRFYAHVFRGAQRYWRENIGGLTKPEKGGLGKMKYAAHDKDGTDKNRGEMLFPPGATPDILIYRNRNSENEWSSDDIFSTTVHETNHWVHYILAGAPNFSNTRLRESWAVGVEWFITQMEYKEKGIGNYGDFDYNPSSRPRTPNWLGYQYWRTGSSLDYTPYFIDLVDNFNQNGFRESTIIDDVTGYTFPQLEQYVKNSGSIGDLQNLLRANKPTGVTDEQLNNLFGTYLSNFQP